jgi:hypothetical protein
MVEFRRPQAARGESGKGGISHDGDREPPAISLWLNGALSPSGDDSACMPRLAGPVIVLVAGVAILDFALRADVWRQEHFVSPVLRAEALAPGPARKAGRPSPPKSRAVKLETARTEPTSSVRGQAETTASAVREQTSAPRTHSAQGGRTFRNGQRPLRPVARVRITAPSTPVTGSPPQPEPSPAPPAQPIPLPAPAPAPVAAVTAVASAAPLASSPPTAAPVATPRVSATGAATPPVQQRSDPDPTRSVSSLEDRSDDDDFDDDELGDGPDEVDDDAEGLAAIDAGGRGHGDEADEDFGRSDGAESGGGDADDDEDDGGD